jgi:hypothetical protein
MKKILSLLLIIFLSAEMAILPMPLQAANIEAGSSTAAPYRPTIDTAPNGVPIINLAALTVGSRRSF